MFVYNFSLNKKSYIKVFKYILIILAIIILVFSIYTIFTYNKTTENSSKVIELDSSNYTNFLKESHEDLNKYIGKEIQLTGYVYRLPDFADDQFVLARTMLINSNSQAVVVGILCNSNNAKDFEDYSWVTVRGTVYKGNYHGEIPMLDILEIKKSQTPDDEFVSEPVD